MKSIALFFALCLLISSAAFADDSSPEYQGPPHRGHRLDRMKQELQLTEEQVQKIRETIENSPRGKCRDIEDQDARRSCWRDARTERQQAIGAILTDEQRAKFEKMKEDRQEKRQERRARWQNGDHQCCNDHPRGERFRQRQGAGGNE